MPELPEVETVRRGLAPVLVGRRILAVEVLDPRLVQPAGADDVVRALRGHEISAVSRRGKYLLIELEGAGLIALHHLRMTGSFAAPASSTAATPEPAHVRLRYHLSGLAGAVVYNDPRRFGTLKVANVETVHQFLDARLGPEPLADSWGAAQLAPQLRRRHASLKAVLLDQRVVAGLGNIYVDEACFLAGVRPDLPADRVTRAGAERLVFAIKQRLREAIDAGGSTLRDYRGVTGESGTMQERFLVYGRSGLICERCGETLRGGRVAGRGTTWCARCQPAGRPR